MIAQEHAFVDQMRAAGAPWEAVGLVYGSSAAVMANRPNRDTPERDQIMRQACRDARDLISMIQEDEGHPREVLAAYFITLLQHLTATAGASDKVVKYIPLPPLPLPVIEAFGIEKPAPAPVRVHIGKIEAIIESVADAYGVASIELTGHSRLKVFAVPRQHAMWIAVKEYGCSYPLAARVFNRDHTTVLHGVRRHQARIDAGTVEVSL